MKAKHYKKIIRPLDNLMFSHKKFRMEDTVLIAGSPRSGTSWFMEVLGNIPNYVYLFEPLNPKFFHEAGRLKFHSRVYVPASADWREGEEFFKKVFSGHFIGFQSLYEFTARDIMNLLLAKKLLVKSIGINRLLPWISNKFKLNKIFYIIRHPCAVVASQLNTGWCGYHSTSPPYQDIIPSIETVVNDALKIKEFHSDFLEKLKNITTREETLAVVWCLDNYIPLLYQKSYPWNIVTYEKLITCGKEELSQLIKKIGVEKIPNSAIHSLKIPSGLTADNDLYVIARVNDQLSKWKKILSKKQAEAILKIVSDFGLGFYSEDVEPDYENIVIQ